MGGPTPWDDHRAGVGHDRPAPPGEPLGVVEAPVARRSTSRGAAEVAKPVGVVHVRMPHVAEAPAADTAVVVAGLVAAEPVVAELVVDRPEPEVVDATVVTFGSAGGLDAAALDAAAALTAARRSPAPPSRRFRRR